MRVRLSLGDRREQQRQMTMITMTTSSSINVNARLIDRSCGSTVRRPPPSPFEIQKPAPSRFPAGVAGGEA
jgi:hypothetical protein